MALAPCRAAGAAPPASLEVKKTSRRHLLPHSIPSLSLHRNPNPSSAFPVAAAGHRSSPPIGAPPSEPNRGKGTAISSSTSTAVARLLGGPVPSYSSSTPFPSAARRRRPRQIPAAPALLRCSKRTQTPEVSSPSAWTLSPSPFCSATSPSCERPPGRLPWP